MDKCFRSGQSEPDSKTTLLHIHALAMTEQSRVHGCGSCGIVGIVEHARIQSGTSRFRDVKLRWPGHAPWRGVEAS